MNVFPEELITELYILKDNTCTDKMYKENELRTLFEEFIIWYQKEQDIFPQYLRITEDEFDEVIYFLKNQKGLLQSLEILRNLEFVWYRIYHETSNKNERVLWFIQKYEDWFLDTYRPNDSKIAEYYNLPFGKRVNLLCLP